jgi:hypothetical protein
MQIDRKVVEQLLELLETTISSHGDIARFAIADLHKALAKSDQVPQTFEEFLANDEGVLLFGLELRDEWIDAARAGWDAAMRAKQENV